MDAERSSARHASSVGSHPSVANAHATFDVSTAFISPARAALTTERSVASHVARDGCHPILANPHSKFATSTPVAAPPFNDVFSNASGVFRSSDVSRSYTPADVISTAPASTATATEWTTLACALASSSPASHM